MSWISEIQETDNIIGDIGKVLLDKYFPSKSVSAPVAEATPEPVAAKPLLVASPLALGSPVIIVGVLVACYYIFIK